MKKHKFTLALVLFISRYASAQVTLTIQDSLPLGTNIIFNYINTDTNILNNFRFNKTGTNNLWDFSKFDLENQDTVKTTSPNQTIYKEDFNDCSIAFEDIDIYKNIYFYKTDTSGFYEVGFAGNFSIAPFAQIIKYKQPPPVLLFPARYPYITIDTNYMRTKTFLSDWGDSAYCERYAYTYREIVATGIIKLPFGNFESFLLKSVTSTIDTSWFKGIDGKLYSYINLIPSTNIYFDWFCNKSTFHVARVLGHYEYPSGIDNQSGILVQMNNYANLKSVSVNDVEPSQINIYPNPASSKLFIENMNLKNSSYTINNISGREIKRDNISTEINIEDLQHGMYIIRLYANNELKGRVKFVKQ